MRISLVILSVLLASHMTYSLSKGIQQLQTKMDFFLESVVEVKRSIRDLRNDVKTVQEQQNTTTMCISDPDLSDSSVTSTSENHATDYQSNEKYDSVEVLQKGLQDEKAVIRALVHQQNEALVTMAKEMDDVKTGYASKIMLKGVRAELDDKHTEQHQAIGDVTSTVKNLTKEINDKLADQNKAIKVEVERALEGIKTELDKRIGEKNSEHLKFIDTVSSAVDATKKGLNERLNEQNKKVDNLERTLQDIKANSELIFVLPSLGFRKYRTSLYKLFNDKVTRSEAQQRCQDEGFYLAEVNDDDEFKFIKEWLRNIDVYYTWFGGTDSEVEGTWRWSKSGLKVSDDWWGKNQPDDYCAGEDCMLYSRPFHGFSDSSCGNKYRFMCEFGPFMVRGSSMYMFHMNKVTWAQAKTTCHNEGYYLAEMNDDDELEFVNTKVGKHDFWIGGTDARNEGFWFWATSRHPVAGSLWAPGEPNNSDIENCMHSYGSNRSKCYDGDCDDKLMFVCEKEI